jgi:hypothetical protein
MRIFFSTALVCFLSYGLIPFPAFAEEDPPWSHRQIEGFDHEIAKKIVLDDVKEGLTDFERGLTELKSVACYLYPHFMVKEIPLSSGARVSIIPILDGKTPPCDRAKQPGERVFPEPNGGFYFLGARGDLVFMLQREDWIPNDALEVYKLRPAPNPSLFNAHAVYADADEVLSLPFISTKPIEDLKVSGTALSLRLKQLYFANCSLARDESGCWAEIKKETGLTDAQKPHCTYWADFEKKAYETRRKAGRTEEEIKSELNAWLATDKSIIEYPIALIEHPIAQGDAYGGGASTSIEAGETRCIPNIGGDLPQAKRRVFKDDNLPSPDGFDKPLTSVTVIADGSCMRVDNHVPGTDADPDSFGYDRKTFRKVEKCVASAGASCVYYPHFMVKGTASDSPITSNISIVFSPDSKTLTCTGEVQPGETALGEGNFIGTVGNYIFLDMCDGNPGGPFRIVDKATGHELFTDDYGVFTKDEGFKGYFQNLKLSGSTLTAEYIHSSPAGCYKARLALNGEKHKITPLSGKIKCSPWD